MSDCLRSSLIKSAPWRQIFPPELPSKPLDPTHRVPFSEIPKDGALVLEIDTKSCAGTKDEVNYLEHVQAFITLKSGRRGDTMIYLTSPLGTKSLLLSKRPLDDDSHDGFHRWPFMTTHAWAEKTQGIWKLEIFFDSNNGTTGTLFEWTLLLHGTKQAPYKDQTPLSPRTKLAVAKNIHTKGFEYKNDFFEDLMQDHQKRLGDDIQSDGRAED